jgi:hypothetical protein
MFSTCSRPGAHSFQLKLPRSPGPARVDVRLAPWWPTARLHPLRQRPDAYQTKFSGWTQFTSCEGL